MSNGFGAPPLWRPWRLLLCFGYVLAGCGQAPNGASNAVTTKNPQPGIAQAHFALLSSNCTVTASGMSVVVNADETANLALDATTGKVTLNGSQASGLPCEMDATLTVNITPGTAGDHDVLLDLSSGLFSKATSAGIQRIKLNLGPGFNDTVTVRGSTGDDHFYLGKATAANTTLLNFNGGTGAGYDAFPDVSMIGAEHVVVLGGDGDDIIDASGSFGTLAPFPLGLSLYGGLGDDILKGGAADDMLSGDAGDDQLNGGKGNNTYACGSAGDGTDVISVTATAVDTVDYSQRFNAVSVVLDGTASSGESGENDTLPDAIAVVLGGAGNDTLSALGSTRSHTLRGGPGNDTLIGGTGNDSLDGGNGGLEVDGDDVFIGAKATALYTTRTQPITVTVNASGMGGADANDGDPTVTRHAQTVTSAAPGATITASTNTVTGLVNMNAGSIGHRLILTGTSSLHDDGSYRIAAVTGPGSVVLNASDTAAKNTWANDAAASWSFTEDAGAEKDEVRCANVIGSATASNTLTGDANDNRLTGGAVIDTLVGGAGDDTLTGLDDNDALYGGAGEDTLIGGPGDDALYGGDDNDVLEGDDGADSFECDGKDSASTAGSAPGPSDFTVDYRAGSPDYDTRPALSGCDY